MCSWKHVDSSCFWKPVSSRDWWLHTLSVEDRPLAGLLPTQLFNHTDELLVQWPKTFHSVPNSYLSIMTHTPSPGYSVLTRVTVRPHGWSVSCRKYDSLLYKVIMSDYKGCLSFCTTPVKPALRQQVTTRHVFHHPQLMKPDPDVSPGPFVLFVLFALEGVTRQESKSHNETAGWVMMDRHLSLHSLLPPRLSSWRVGHTQTNTPAQCFPTTNLFFGFLVLSWVALSQPRIVPVRFYRLPVSYSDLLLVHLQPIACEHSIYSNYSNTIFSCLSYGRKNCSQTS